MGANLFTKADWLRVDKNKGYGLLPIPQSRDQQITEILRQWMNLDDISRRAAADNIPDHQRFTFLAYSERAASWAVRESKDELIVLGLLALGIDGWRDDLRDSILVVALHYDAAQRLGADPKTLFEKAAALLPENVAKALHAFLNRSTRDKSLEVMGYVVRADPDGFRYARTW